MEPTQILVQEQHYTNEESRFESFAEFIAYKRGYPKKGKESKDEKKRDLTDLNVPQITTRELAGRLNLSYEVLRKIINERKRTKRRDCIIAICYALCLGSYDTDEALRLYGMECLDVYNRGRDDVIVEELENQSVDPWNPKEIAYLDRCLTDKGYEALNIIEHRSSTQRKSAKKNATIRILEKKVQSYVDIYGGLTGDPYDSLATEYAPERYHCKAEMDLQHTKTNKLYRLSIDSNGCTGVKIYKKNGESFIEIDSSATDIDASDYFEELEAERSRKMKEMLAILRDTRNYSQRYSAGIYDDVFHVYAETYNYRIPELEEYYLYDSSSSETCLLVFKSSEFMHRYLVPKQYKALYGSKPNEAVAQYQSIQDLEDRISGSDGKSVENKDLLRSRLRYFKELQLLVDSVKDDIRSGKRYVRRLDYIYEDRDRVCEYFQVDKEFECSLDAEYADHLEAGVEAYDFVLDDGTVTVTCNDLYKAFELGFHDINEICRVKKRFGRIENIFE